MKIEIEQTKRGERTVLEVDWPGVPRSHEMVEVRSAEGVQLMRGWVATVTWNGIGSTLVCRVVLGTISGDV